MSRHTWVRALLALDRIAGKLVAVHESFRDETLMAWVHPKDRDVVNALIYDKQSQYVRGGAQFERGLFDWEVQLLSSDTFPREGHVLLAGAGGGREALALAERGYDVYAFEPSPRLYQQLHMLTARYPGIRAKQASFMDLVSLAEGGDGRLEGFLDHSIAAVVYGWGSFAHIVGIESPAQVLNATRKVAPRAPVLLSFLPPQRLEHHSPGRFRQALRRVFAGCGAPGSSSLPTGFLPHGGFYRGLDAHGIQQLATEAGYAVSLSNRWPYGHALLVPEPSGSE